MFKNLWGNKQDVEVQESTSVVKSSESREKTEETHGVGAETLAKVLQILGRHAFDLDDGNKQSIEKDFERWARHVLLGTPTTDGPEPNTQSIPLKRDWGSLCQFVNRHRQHEKSFVVKGFYVLREVVWTFTRIVSQAFIQDTDTDIQMRSHIGRLHSAVSTKSPEDLKKEVQAAAEGLGKLLEDRSLRQKARLEELGAKLREVEVDLGHARKQMALDGLTQLYNRAALDEEIERICALTILAVSHACVVMVDIDHFKNVNDSYGHRAGDSVIREVAKRTVLAFPRKTDFAARYGGEEFAVILQNTSLEDASSMGERLLAAVQQEPIIHEDLELLVTVSIGVAEFFPGETSGCWLERADQALYRAKQGGRNQVCVAGKAESTLTEV